ncbi:hypothetical protein [Desulfosediminicola sp.]|uniref:hypothetical protein n=1 Tax=Desulfosediminicola sp. TaxID=2886825 RepID=UPI003AF1EF8E
MDLNEKRSLGKTGLLVGRLGVASGYGASAEAYEMAFERGCNYFYWSSPRKPGMGEAIRNICRQGKRDELVIVLQSYSRSARLMEYFFTKGLKDIGLDSVDVLLLGWHNSAPWKRIMARARQMQEKGMFRHLALSGHNRGLFPELASQGSFDLFHLRYNAAHRGAEREIFAKLDPPQRPGLVSYTATRWGHLINPKKVPPGEAPLTSSDCYRFVLSNPAVDVCMCGPADVGEMAAALHTLDAGPLDETEMARVKSIGDYVHQHSGKFW